MAASSMMRRRRFTERLCDELGHSDPVARYGLIIDARASMNFIPSERSCTWVLDHVASFSVVRLKNSPRRAMWPPQTTRRATLER